MKLYMQLVDLVLGLVHVYSSLETACCKWLHHIMMYT